MSDDALEPGNDKSYMAQKFDSILTEISREMRAMHRAHLIKPFEGNPHALKEWLRDIGKYQLLMNAGDTELCKLAYETSRGIASKLIEQHAKANPQGSWEDMKTVLIDKFPPYSDYDPMFPSLEEHRQGRERPNAAQGEDTDFWETVRWDEDMETEDWKINSFCSYCSIPDHSARECQKEHDKS